MPAAPPAAPGFMVSTVAHRRLDTVSPEPWAAHELDHLVQLARGAGVGLLAGAGTEGTNNSFEEMATAVLPDLGEQPDPVDLLVLAYATPDFAPLSLTGPVLAERLPGEPRLFGVTDQGRTASFTMLALARAYARRNGMRRVVAMAFDQATRVFDTELSPARRADGDHVVALVIEAGDEGAPDGLQVRQEAGVAPGDVPAALDRLLDALAPEGASAVLLGAGIDPDWRPRTGAAEVWRAPLGAPCTALLAGLAGRLPAVGDAPVLLAEYDEELGDLSVCRVGAVAG